MRKFCVLLFCLLMVFSAASAFAQNKGGQSSGGKDKDKAQIEALFQRYLKAFNARDVNAIMAEYSSADLFVFDVVPPREFPSWDAYKKDFEGLFGAFPGPVENKLSDLSITTSGTMAFAHNIQTVAFTAKDGSKFNVVVRVSDVLRKMNGKWLIVHEHVSVPVDLATGKAVLQATP